MRPLGTIEGNCLHISLLILFLLFSSLLSYHVDSANITSCLRETQGTRGIAKGQMPPPTEVYVTAIPTLVELNISLFVRNLFLFELFMSLFCIFVNLSIFFCQDCFFVFTKEEKKGKKEKKINLF